MSDVEVITRLSEIKKLTTILMEKGISDEVIRKNLDRIRTLNEVINRFEEISSKKSNKKHLRELKTISELLIDSLKKISKSINKEKEIINFNQLRESITKIIKEKEIEYLIEETKKEKERLKNIFNKKETKEPLNELLNKIRINKIKGPKSDFFKIIKYYNQKIIIDELTIKEALKDEALSNKQKQEVRKLIRTLNESKRIINQAIKQRVITNELRDKICENDNEIIEKVSEILEKPDKIIDFIEKIRRDYVPTIIRARERDYHAMLSISQNKYRLNSDKVMDKDKNININAMHVPLAYHYGLIKPREANLNINLKLKKNYLYENDYSYTRIVNYNGYKVGIILLKKRAYKSIKERITRVTTHIDKRYNSCLFVYRITNEEEFKKYSRTISTTDNVNEIIENLKEIIKSKINK